MPLALTGRGLFCCPSTRHKLYTNIIASIRILQPGRIGHTRAGSCTRCTTGAGAGCVRGVKGDLGGCTRGDILC